MAFAFVQGATQDNAAAPAVTITPTTNNLMVVYAMVANITDTPTISDTQVNAWTHATNNNTNDGHGDQLHMWWAVSKNSNSTTITIGGLATSNGSIAYGEYSGNATASVADGDQNAVTTSTGSADSINSGAIVTTADGDLIVGVSFDNIAVHAPTAGTGETNRATSSKATGLGLYDWRFEDRVQTTHGSITPTWTDAGVDSFTSMSGAFKVAGGAATTHGSWGALNLLGAGI